MYTLLYKLSMTEKNYRNFLHFLFTVITSFSQTNPAASGSYLLILNSQVWKQFTSLALRYIVLEPLQVSVPPSRTLIAGSWLICPIPPQQIQADGKTKTSNGLKYFSIGQSAGRGTGYCCKYYRPNKYRYPVDGPFNAAAGIAG